MDIIYNRSFRKMFVKHPKKIQEKFRERLALLITNPLSPLLNIHSLSGEWVGCQSFNITGDIRVVFEQFDEHSVQLLAIGSHSELYF